MFPHIKMTREEHFGCGTTELVVKHNPILLFDPRHISIEIEGKILFADDRGEKMNKTYRKCKQFSNTFWNQVDMDYQM